MALSNKSTYREILSEVVDDVLRTQVIPRSGSGTYMGADIYGVTRRLLQIDPKLAVEFRMELGRLMPYSLPAQAPPNTLHSHSILQAGQVSEQSRGPSYIEMLAMRWPSPLESRGAFLPIGWKTPCFDEVVIHKGDAKILVFIITKGDNYVVLEDDVNMYPSDQLVSQIRVLEG